MNTRIACLRAAGQRRLVDVGESAGPRTRQAVIVFLDLALLQLIVAEGEAGVLQRRGEMRGDWATKARKPCRRWKPRESCPPLRR